ncbi:MAG TPA: hypothetical protein VK636_20435 [Gemmatimonadaceae bacterium]|nr:hypothetical protein [Gemmatimonadaceae bacterium]
MPTAEQRQAIFDGGRDAAVTAAAEKMSKRTWGGLGSRRTLREILTYLAGKRKKVADKQEDAHAPEFGALRENHVHEAVVLAGPHASSRAHMAAYGHVSSKTEITARYPAERTEVTQTMANPERLRSASIIRAPDNAQNAGEVVGYHMKTPSGTKVTATAAAGILDANASWAHTPPSLVGVVLDEAEVWHGELLTGHNSIKVHALGMVTWHVCNAMPYRRGSAAVAEWYNLAAIRAFDLDLGQRGGFLDLPAFRIDAVRYANNYAQIYAGRYRVT